MTEPTDAAWTASLTASPWVVTSRRKVHVRNNVCARRIAFPNPWLPSVATPRDHACITCLAGLLPSATEERWICR